MNVNVKGVNVYCCEKENHLYYQNFTNMQILIYLLLRNKFVDIVSYTVTLTTKPLVKSSAKQKNWTKICKPPVSDG